MATTINGLLGYAPGLQFSALNPVVEHAQSFINQSFYDNYGHSPSPSELAWVWSVTSTTFIIGAAAGSLLFGPLADRLGTTTVNAY